MQPGSTLTRGSLPPASFKVVGMVNRGMHSSEVDDFLVLYFLLPPHSFQPGEQMLPMNPCETIVHSSAGLGPSPLSLASSSMCSIPIRLIVTGFPPLFVITHQYCLLGFCQCDLILSEMIVYCLFLVRSEISLLL